MPPINGDINDTFFREELIDTFINQIVVYNDKITILYNVQDGYFFEYPICFWDKLVEAAGVEPASENASSGVSPGAGSHLHSLTQAWAATLRRLVASLCMVRAKLTALTCTT